MMLLRVYFKPFESKSTFSPMSFRDFFLNPQIGQKNNLAMAFVYINNEYSYSITATLQVKLMWINDT